MSTIPELTRSRAFHGLTDDDCQIWFGVGIGTLERIEAGEVEPSEELEARIQKFLRVVGGASNPFTPPSPGSLHAAFNGDLTGGAAGCPGRSASFAGGAR